MRARVEKTHSINNWNERIRLIRIWKKEAQVNIAGVNKLHKQLEIETMRRIHKKRNLLT